MATWLLDKIDVSTLAQFDGFAVSGPDRTRTDDWNRITENLAAIGGLEDDWDGLGAKPPSTELLHSARELIESLKQNGIACPSGVAPGMNGTVLFVWEHEGTYMEAEVVRPRRAEWMLVLPGQSPKHWVTA